MNTTANGKPLPTNGEAPKERPKRVRKKPKAVTADKATETTALPQESIYANCGRSASSLRKEEVSWLLEPWVPLSMLTLVAGEPNAGKSTLFAWLLSLPGRSIILPGEEERPELHLRPRLEANGVNLDNVKILDDHPYIFPRDKKVLAGIAKHWGANRIIIDPLDSYFPEGASENDGQVVRPFLESLGWVAYEAGVALIAARHPGKEAGNLLPGSRQWRTVPRQIVELAKVPGDDRRRIIRLDKDGNNTGAKPRYFLLEPTKGKARRFQLEKEVDATDAALVREVEGPGNRWSVMLAGQLIREVFHDEEDPTVEELNARATKKGIGQKALDDAKRLLGVWCKPREKQGKWFMHRESKDWPEWCKAPEY